MRTVENYSDVIQNPEDILVIHRLTLAKSEEPVLMKDWFCALDHHNLYSLFHPGKVPCEWVKPYNIPFTEMVLADQKAYKAYSLAHKTPSKGTPSGTPSTTGGGTPSTVASAAAPRNIDEELNNEGSK